MLKNRFEENSVPQSSLTLIPVMETNHDKEWKWKEQHVKWCKSGFSIFFISVWCFLRKPLYNNLMLFSPCDSCLTCILSATDGEKHENSLPQFNVTHILHHPKERREWLLWKSSPFILSSPPFISVKHNRRVVMPNVFLSSSLQHETWCAVSTVHSLFLYQNTSQRETKAMKTSSSSLFSWKELKRDQRETKWKEKTWKEIFDLDRFSSDAFEHERWWWWWWCCLCSCWEGYF